MTDFLRAAVLRLCYWLNDFLKTLCLLLLLWTTPVYIGRKSVTATERSCARRPPKPAWVRKEVIRLKAFMPHEGCRKVANVFNRLHQDTRNMTVGKTYVYNTIKQHRYDIQVLRRNIKNRKPRPLPGNLLWSLDLTQVRDAGGRAHILFGIVDAGSRACLYLEEVPTKASIVLLRCLLDTIERYGKPKIVRTDNEAIFISRLFRFGLWLLGIKHQRTDKCCPWMNGKIERFFGTLKSKLSNYVIESYQALEGELASFRLWYNHVRPHQHLNGRTPAEAWNRQQPNTTGKNFYFAAWNGALTGFYLPPS